MAAEVALSPTRAQIPQQQLSTDRGDSPSLMVNIGLAAFIIYAIQTSGPVLALNESHLVQRTVHADSRVNHPGHAGTHRLLHHADGQRHDQRSEIHWLTANPRATDDELAKHPGRRS